MRTVAAGAGAFVRLLLSESSLNKLERAGFLCGEIVAAGRQRGMISTLHSLSSDIRGKRSYDRPCVPAAPARLCHQKLFSILANSYFWTKAIERRIGTGFDLDTFNLTAVIAGLTNDLRKLAFMNAGRGRGLGDRERRTYRQRESNKCQLESSRHLFLIFDKSA